MPLDQVFVIFGAPPLSSAIGNVNTVSLPVAENRQVRPTDLFRNFPVGQRLIGGDILFFLGVCFHSSHLSDVGNPCKYRIKI